MATTKSKKLGVWLDDLHVADLERRGPVGIRCRYTADALSTWPGNSPVISCAVPLGRRPVDATAFCRGLLPEGRALQSLAARAGLATNDTFGLLARYGRDIAGALVIDMEQPDAGRYGTELLDADGLARAIDDLDDHPLGAHDDSELSLAGLQDKLLLVRLQDGRWARPQGGMPSTHILKIDDARHPGLVAAEAQCLDLAAAIGLTNIDARLQTIAGTPCLIVARFDRTVTADGIRRIHQEDLCQACGIDPDGARGRAKYQAAGGPGFADAARLLDAYATDPVAALDALCAAMTFTMLIGNADAHGKNLALLHPGAERIELAPLYDTVPTVLWPRLRTAPAMTVAGATALEDIRAGHLVSETASWGVSVTRAHAVVARTIARVMTAVSSGVIPAGSNVADLVRERATFLTGG